MAVTVKRHTLANNIEQDPRWAMVVMRDASADGKFYYAVKTTGVYCCPSCPSRLAKPENIEFYNSREEAQLTGFRACKRCKPDQISLAEQHAAKVSEICKLIENAEETLSLEQLASHAGMSIYHFHRIFKKVTGLTPKAYTVAHQAKRIRNKLGHSGTVTEAIFDAGYNSNSRFYEKSKRILGMTPTNYRAGGKDADIHFALGECSLGTILVASSTLGVCMISLGDDPEVLIRELQDRLPKANLIGGDADFEHLVAKVVGFIEAPAIGLNLPLDIRGTAFQQRVWQALCEIPVGSTASYKDIAVRIGSPKAVRAVAGACAANILAIAIPCHRVIKSDGALSGYRWGVEHKRALLAREAKTK
jgi:AraC family transcriptional regulator of adaptative response/methylated-DNA-[protein]-cysteine methyltransferase